MNKNLLLIIVAAVIIAGAGVAYGLVQKHDKDLAQQKAEDSAMMLKDYKAKQKADDAMMKDETSSDTMMKDDTSAGTDTTMSTDDTMTKAQ